MFHEFIEFELSTFCCERTCRSEIRPVEEQPPAIEAKARDRPLKAELEELRAEKKQWEKIRYAIQQAIRRFPEAMSAVMAAVEATREPCPA